MIRLVLLVGVTSFVCILSLSIAYRLSKDKPIFLPAFPVVQFLETGQSGWSDRDALSRIGSVRFRLWVAIDQHDLWISPHFPFNLCFIPEAFHLDFRIQGKQIMAVTERAYGADHLIHIQFRHATGDEDSVTVTVNDVETFHNALASIRKQ